MFDSIQSNLLMEKLIKTTKGEKNIRKALEDAKKQNAIWCKHIIRPTVSGDGLIDPTDAKEYFKQCIKAVENGLVEMAQRFSPVQWLWYLRRFPSIHYVEDHGFESYSLTLASILSGKSQRKDNSNQFGVQFNFPLNHSIADYILAFVAGNYDLADLHIKYGAAAREIPFRIRAKRLPDPVISESKRKAGQIFDARMESYGLTGTIPSKTELRQSSQMFVIHDVYYPIASSLPYFEFRGLETPPFIPSYYLIQPVHLKHISNLYRLTDNGNGQWLNYEVFSLMLLACLMLPISASGQEHSINIAMYGYSVHERGDFIRDYWPAFDNWVSEFKELFPNAILPDTWLHFIALLNGMETIEVSSHPIVPGVILGDTNWVIVDHASINTRLNKMLQFPSLGGETGNKRGVHFEDAVQSYIDASSWRPNDGLRAMRQLHLVRQGENNQNRITDIDAIGASGDTLLIVSCKAIIFNVGQDIGEYDALKTARLRLDEAVRKWQEVKAELLDSPVGQNFDFSRYSKILAIVCTPNVVYTESELSLAYEVSGIRKAATAYEFLEWLNT